MTRKRIDRDRARRAVRIDRDRARRAVSDVIAFTIVFSIIITSVGIVSAVGFTTLRDVQTGEQTKNAQRALQALGKNLNDVERGHAPGRTGELKLTNGKLYLRPTGSDAGKIKVDVSNSGFEQPGILGSSGKEFTVGTLYYQVTDEDRWIALESGAVFRRTRGNAVMIEDPKFLCRDANPADGASSGQTYALVSIMKIVPPKNEEQPDIGGGTVQIRGREKNSYLLASDVDSDPETITVEITNSAFSDNGKAWKQGLVNKGWTWNSGKAECTAEYVYVRMTVLEIEFVK